MEGMAQLLTREGPEHDEIRIIGVELAITPNDGHGEVELEMFACSHTMPRGYRWDSEVRVTLHTSAGDVTLRGRM
jgi:hypothetical protein